MTPQELKNSILQLAIQGRLVEQRPEEGTAEELYQQIQREKAALVKAGKIKKEKPLPEITEEEVPFEIPEGWKWVHLNYIATSGLGKTLDKAKNTGVSCPYLCSINVYWTGIDTGKVKEALFTDDDREKYRLRKGDLLICEGGDVGRSAIWESDDEMYYQNALHRVRFYGDIDPYFYRYLLECYKGLGIINEYSKGVTIKHLVQNSLYAMWLPLPPLAEQKRIVAKIEELLPYIDRYEKAWSRLEDFNKRFPTDMQKSILQLAIQGKLVPQRPEEGTGEALYQQIQAEKQSLIRSGKLKKEKPLPEITPDEIPFDIPESWKWVRFGVLYTLSNGTASRGSKDGSEHPVLRLADLSNNEIDVENVRLIRLTDKEFESHKLVNDDLVFIRVNGSKDRVATAFHYTGNHVISYCDHLFCGHKTSEYVYEAYVRFAFNCPSTREQLIPEIKTTAGQNTISQASMVKILLPLPPLAEQMRIVAKLEELLPLCKQLNAI